jgi:hypothetical protein
MEETHFHFMVFGSPSYASVTIHHNALVSLARPQNRNYVNYLWLLDTVALGKEQKVGNTIC